ncbi:hypothetical protein BJ992_001340 [Sphaerisporangium rubeum]|uniref:Uncharacterized protein n=1 Tax=Sphaerisporangium rubeum TaxID=321317 RepID=A0A7X0ICD1_9ACTN|nr:hypothetical protein [Sphaerisporangium rubeum]
MLAGGRAGPRRQGVGGRLRGGGGRLVQMVEPGALVQHAEAVDREVPQQQVVQLGQMTAP